MKKLLPLIFSLLIGITAIAQTPAIDVLPASASITERITLFPNPVVKALSIEVKNYDYKSLTFKIKDLTGQGVYTKLLSPIEAVNNVYELDLSVLPKGIYIVDIIDQENGQATVKRLIKK